MVRQDGSIEQIYIAHITQSPEANYVGAYVIAHLHMSSSEGSRFIRWCYPAEKAYVAGYLDGATTVSEPRVRGIVNGIPDSVREGALPHSQLEKLSATAFTSLLQEAGLQKRSDEGRVIFFPMGFPR